MVAYSGNDPVIEAAGTGTVSVVALDGICYLKAGAATAAPKFGMSVYVSQTASDNGTVTVDDSTNSAVFVGYYFGGEGAIASGDFIPVSC